MYMLQAQDSAAIDVLEQVSASLIGLLCRVRLDFRSEPRIPQLLTVAVDRRQIIPPLSRT